MKRLALASLALFLAMMACSPFAVPLSAADSQATSMASIQTQAALTMAAKPTQRPSRTPEPTATLLVAPTETSTSAPSDTATSAPPTDGSVSATSSLTLTVAGPTATPSATSSPTASATATLSGTVTVTLTFTPGVLTYGTIPPEVPYGYVTLKNLSNDMVYISFRCAMTNGLTSLLEYPVYSVVKEKLPTGTCQWTAFVKNQEFKGELHVKKFEEYTFTFKPKKVTITQP